MSSFDPVTLEVSISDRNMPDRHAEALFFFHELSDDGHLNIWKILRYGWGHCRIASTIYGNMEPEARQDVHDVLGDYIHEATHRADLLSTPLGVSYRELLSCEHQIFQQYIPLLLYARSAPAGLNIRNDLLGDVPPPAIPRDNREAMNVWRAMRRTVLLTQVWGDMAYKRPEVSPSRGWDGECAEPIQFFRDGPQVRLVEFKGIKTLLPEGLDGWHLRPAAILEAKAVAGTLLWILTTSPAPREDAEAYWGKHYGSQRDNGLFSDYLFVFDIIAGFFGCARVDDLIARMDPEPLESFMRIVRAVCWFALHAPPPEVPGDYRDPSSSPVIRLTAGLHALPEVIAKTKPGGSAAELCLALDRHPAVVAAHQVPVCEAMERSRRRLDGLAQVSEDVIWHADVREHLHQVAAIMQPHFNRDHYNSLISMSETGNPYAGIESEASARLVDSDGITLPGMRTWSRLRRQLIFLRPAGLNLEHGLVTGLDEHFAAEVAFVANCEHCNLAHVIWFSRHTNRPLCPETNLPLNLKA